MGSKTEKESFKYGVVGRKSSILTSGLSASYNF